MHRRASLGTNYSFQVSSHQPLNLHRVNSSSSAGLPDAGTASAYLSLLSVDSGASWVPQGSFCGMRLAAIQQTCAPSFSQTGTGSPSQSSTMSQSTSPTPSSTRSQTQSPSQSRSQSQSLTQTHSETPTISVSPSTTPSLSVTPSVTPSQSRTASVTPSQTVTPTSTGFPEQAFIDNTNERLHPISAGSQQISQDSLAAVSLPC